MKRVMSNLGRTGRGGCGHVYGIHVDARRGSLCQLGIGEGGGLMLLYDDG